MATQHQIVRPASCAGGMPHDDRVIARPDLGLFAVVDGFGGPRWSGHNASFVARQLVRRFAAHRGAPEARLREALAGAHGALLRDARLTRGTGGATVTAVALSGGHAWLAHLGAGRCALRRGPSCVELARDDRVAACCLRLSGFAPPGPRGREVTTALGCPGLAFRPSYRVMPLRADDHLLLATDGFVADAPEAHAGSTDGPDAKHPTCSTPRTDPGVLLVVRWLDPG